MSTTGAAHSELEQWQVPPKGLSKEDRRVYCAIPSGLEYVGHGSFSAASMEKRLFGPDRREIRVPQYLLFSEIPQDVATAHRPSFSLDPEDEASLFLRYNYAKYRVTKLQAAQRRRRSLRRARQMLLWHRRAMEVRAKIVNANMALVMAMAKRTTVRTVEFAELVGEGNLALLRAVEKFDVSRGFKFSTYACRAILKAFSRLAIKAGDYRKHVPVEFDPMMEHSDQVERRHNDQRELAIEDIQLVLNKNTARLNDVERAVVGARFAVAGYNRRRTLQEVGDLVGLSKERVRQVQKECLSKIRDAFERQCAI